jgi:hypothetical protein
MNINHQFSKNVLISVNLKTWSIYSYILKLSVIFFIFTITYKNMLAAIFEKEQINALAIGLNIFYVQI